MPNRLAKEKSPYLRLHADNPVDWYPWSEEAFRKARELDKPIFLSIGYYTCHWCHVMNRESFSDPEVARELNRVFIPIKVDREERPDIDSLYMKYAFAVMGSGGWPLTVLLTPDKKPFFIATYLPRETLLQLIRRVDELWRGDRSQIYRYAEQLVSGMLSSGFYMVGDSFREPGRDLVENLVQRLAGSYDPIYGGFGHPPKFPNPHRHLFLMRYSWISEEGFPYTMVHHTLVRMRFGGIYDHVWGGFHRYSTDAIWKLPHFEKMLYDQAWLIRVYSEAFQFSGDWIFMETVYETYRFLTNWLSSGEAFYSAVDAESEGVEGRFYVWSLAEFREALGDLYDPAYKVFGLTEEGNYLEEASGRRTGFNVLYPAKRWEEHATKLGMGFEEFIDYIGEVIMHLRRHREKRPKPNVDYKILADWNSMVIGSLAYASTVYNDGEMLNTAVKAMDFILEKMYLDRLKHVYIDGEASVDGFLDDYASLIYALNELYMAGAGYKYLSKAVEAAEDMINLFRHPEMKIFFHTSREALDLPHPDIELFDGPYPSGESMAIYELMRLARLTGEEKYWEIGLEALKTVLPNVERSIEAAPHLASATILAATGGGEAVIKGETFRGLTRMYKPLHIHHFIDEAPPIEYVSLLTAQGDGIYVCYGYTCLEPAKTLSKGVENIYRIRSRWSG